MSQGPPTAVLDLLARRLYSSQLGLDLFSAALAEIDSTVITDVEKEIMPRLITNGVDRQLRNFLHAELPKIATPWHPLIDMDHLKESLSYLRKAQSTWEKRMLKSVNTMCSEHNLPLAGRRSDKDVELLASKWTELSVLERDVSTIRPVYAPKDFLDVLAGIRNPNCKQLVSGSVVDCPVGIGVIQVPLNVPDLSTLQQRFCELALGGCSTTPLTDEEYATEREKLAMRVLEHGCSAVAQEFCKRGSPLSHRASLWSLALALHIGPFELQYLEQLKQAVLDYDLLIDSLFYKDVKLTAANDDMYFVFEDFLYQVLLPFSRDCQVLSLFKTSAAQAPRTYVGGRLGMEQFAVNYPPSGVIPFHGFSMFVVPLCYIINDPAKLYYLFRELYVRYFHRLHCISSHPNGILHLSALFESLLQLREPQLVQHLHNIGVQPLRIAFKWIMRAFSGYLSPEQVLLLWDQILAYESLEPLTFLAVGIFCYRRENLFQVKSFTAAEGVLTDLTTLEVQPIIQLTLFSNISFG